MSFNVNLTFRVAFTGDRLEEELEETLELEENIEAKRARARKREEEAAERVRRQETIFGIVLVVGELGTSPRAHTCDAVP